jgi:hypothetical protein
MKSVKRQLDDIKGVDLLHIYNKYSKTEAYTNVYSRVHRPVSSKIVNGTILIRDVIWRINLK